MPINHDVIATFTVVFSVNNLSNDVLMSLSILDDFVKHFSIFAPFAI
jgi:hypothetical protein